MTRKLINGQLQTVEEVIKSHSGLVHKIANKSKLYAASLGHDYDDIASEGFIGLIKAYEKFDFDKFQTRFATYAIPQIFGAIQNSLRKSDPGVSYPNNLKELGWKIRRAEMEGFTPEEIANHFNTKPHIVVQALDFLQKKDPARLNAPALEIDDEGADLIDTLARYDDMSELYVTEFTSGLTNDEFVVLEGLCFGKSKAQIARELGMSGPSVNRRLLQIREKYIEYETGVITC